MHNQHQTAILVASDAHYGKLTPTFNPEVFVSRLYALSEKLKRIRELNGKTEYDELVIAMMGDINDGTGIYATQPYKQAILNVEQQAFELASHISNFLEEQAKVWGKVRLECVPGNHGRSGKYAHEAANWDIVAYRYMQQQVRDPRVTILLPEISIDPFIRVMKVYNHGYLMYHGHDIRSYGNIPWYGIFLRLLRWKTAMPGWDTAFMGHFHTGGLWEMNGLTALLTGTMVSDDEWAFRTFGWSSCTKWWLFGASVSSPIAWQYLLDLKS